MNVGCPVVLRRNLTEGGWIRRDQIHFSERRTGCFSRGIIMGFGRFEHRNVKTGLPGGRTTEK